MSSEVKKSRNMKEVWTWQSIDTGVSYSNPISKNVYEETSSRPSNIQLKWNMQEQLTVTKSQAYEHPKKNVWSMA